MSINKSSAPTFTEGDFECFLNYLRTDLPPSPVLDLDVAPVNIVHPDITHKDVSPTIFTTWSQVSMEFHPLQDAVECSLDVEPMDVLEWNLF